MRKKVKVCAIVSSILLVGTIGANLYLKAWADSNGVEIPIESAVILVLLVAAMAGITDYLWQMYEQMGRLSVDDRCVQMSRVDRMKAKYNRRLRRVKNNLRRVKCVLRVL